jgi:phosphoribulokinase
MVVPGGKMGLAMELILRPLIEDIIVKKRASMHLAPIGLPV